MSQGEWIGKLELLHARIRDGKEEVTPEEVAWYKGARRMFLTTAAAVQNTTLVNEDRIRGAVRIDRAVPVSIKGHGWEVRCATLDLASGGFAALADAQRSVGDRGIATLELPRAPVIEPVRIVGVSAVGSLARLACAFESPTPAIAVHIEDYLLDTLLPRLVFWDEVLEKM